MKLVLGIFLVLLGVYLILHVGIYLGVIGGLATVLDAMKANPTSTWLIAKGLLKMAGGALLCGFSGTCVIIPGCYIITFSNDK